jgi:hypothetical protein
VPAIDSAGVAIDWCLLTAISAYPLPYKHVQFRIKNIEFIYNKNDIERDQFASNAYNYYINNFERNVIYDKLIQYLNI